MAEANIGTEAEGIKSYLTSALTGYDTQKYYSYLTDAVNPFKKSIDDGKDEAGRPKVKYENLILDQVLTDRIDKVLFNRPDTSFMSKKYTNSDDFALKSLQKNYTTKVDAYKLAHANNPPAGAELIKFNTEFKAEDVNFRLLETVKINMLNENVTRQTVRVTDSSPTNLLLLRERAFYTPVIIGAGDPGIPGVENAAAHQKENYRDLFLPLLTDGSQTTARNPQKNKLMLAHEKDVPFQVTQTDPRQPDFTPINVHAQNVAPPGQFIPTGKLLEYGMAYYEGASEKHNVLGAREAMEKGNAVMKDLNLQLKNQRHIVERRGNILLGLNHPNDPTKQDLFTDIQPRMNTFLDGLVNLPTKPTADGKNVELDTAKVNIKNPDVIKAYNDAMKTAQININTYGAPSVPLIEARKRALNQAPRLKEFLKKHPISPPAVAGAPDLTATALDDLVKLNGLTGMVWERDVPAGAAPAAPAAVAAPAPGRPAVRKGAAHPAARPAAAPTDNERDARIIAAIPMFSEAFELTSVQEDMLALQRAIKGHYPPTWSLNTPDPKQNFEDMLKGHGDKILTAINDYTVKPTDSKPLPPAPASKRGGLSA